MLVLAIQDLRLDGSFPLLKKHFVLAKTRPLNKENIRSAGQWVLSEEMDTMSFLSCCAHLNLDPSAIRSKIRQGVMKDPPVLEVLQSHGIYTN